MSGEQIVAVGAGFLGLRWWWRSWRIGQLTRRIDRADAQRWALLRRWW